MMQSLFQGQIKNLNFCARKDFLFEKISKFYYLQYYPSLQLLLLLYAPSKIYFNFNFTNSLLHCNTIYYCDLLFTTLLL